MVKIRCIWCGNVFEQFIVSRGKSKKATRSQVKCTKCFRLLSSSIKEPTENMFRRHIHKELE